jgi:uncharacterized membrane protein YgcG
MTRTSSRRSRRARLNGPRHTAVRLLALVALALAIVAIPAGALAANEPRLSGPITDLTQDQVTANGRAEAEQALRRLQDEANVQLFALYVDSTGGPNINDYASAVGTANSLGTNDALLVVAVADRTYSLRIDSSLEDVITPDEAEQLRGDLIEPQLRDGDWSGAIAAAASGLMEAASSAAPVGPGTDPGTVPQPAPAGGVNLLPILGIGLLVLGGLWVFGALSSGRRTRQQEKRTAEERDKRTGDLAREANQQLIRADDALRDADQELAFAEAQFGDTEVGPYRDAILNARNEMKAAFAVRQKLDDDVPEDPETRQKLLTEVLERARRAQGLLDEEGSRIAQLRDLERSAPQILAALPAQMDEMEGRIPDSEATLAGLSGYAESSWKAVTGNVAEAQKRIAHARQQVEAGRSASDAGDTSGAARAARSAQEATAEASRLLEAIGTLAKSLREAQATVNQELAAASADVAAARQTVAREGGTLGARLAEAEAALDGAQREIARPQPDFLAAHRLATQANRVADEILAGAQEIAQRRSREVELVASALRQAEASYFRAADFIASRRRGIGRAARTRLAEAESHLERAQSIANEDPRAALGEAQRAYDLAEEAYSQAVDDFDDYDSYGGGIFGGRRGGGIFPFPIIIGGGGWGGSQSGGGWGGTPWGSSGGGGGFGGFGGGSSGGGGFGGGSSGGGRF